MQQQNQGIAFAVCAYVMWGMAPLYFKQLLDVEADEILMHRVIWSFFVVIFIVAIQKNFGKVRQVLKQPKNLLVLTLTSVLIAANWLIFIWAVNAGYLLEASLGYYINPLLNVMLGMIFFNERLTKPQAIAVAIATIGVAIPIVSHGSLPLVALGLAGTFGAYGLLRKKLRVDASTGLFLETSLLLPVALLYWLMLTPTITSNLFTNSAQLNTLLLAAGIVTTLPLLCFAAAASRIPLYMVGFIQYIGPSIMFILAVNLYGEAFTQEKMITFGFLWTALLIFTWDLIATSRRQHKQRTN
ncbi:EamA family transporter RarD [Paraferrimonas haliotis]|uniref:Transporter n=1 Tax=Paraferrimonas haliotis TaxID=2013866 RepID=A0AA37TSX4_9GAMM|nr:EamA family transporter RarD [Paraferrimonas haliotis]GLS84915.1 transporter [Paraferrimonas haliotis]